MFGEVVENSTSIFVRFVDHGEWRQDSKKGNNFMNEEEQQV